MSWIPSRTEGGGLCETGRLWGQVFHNGDPDLICFVWHNYLSMCDNTGNLAPTHTHAANNLQTTSCHHLTDHCFTMHTRHSSNTLLYHTISTPSTGYRRELCREACRDPENLNWLTSSLVRVPYSWSEGHELDPQQDRRGWAMWNWKILRSGVPQWWPRRNMFCLT